MSAATERAAALAAEPFRPAGPALGLATGTAQAVRDVLGRRELLGLLTRREIKARYKDSVLGLIWSLIRPIVQMLVYWLALGRFLQAERGINAFAIFIFTGLTVWQLCVEIVTSGTNSIVGNSGLIKKVYLPRELFPLSAVGSALFNFSMQLVILLAFTAIRREFPTGTRWFYGLLAFVTCVVWATWLGLLLAAVNVYLRDMQYLVEIAVIILFWASPIVYSYRMVADNAPWPWVTSAYAYNPMTIIVLGFQKCFWVAGDRPAPEPDGRLPLWPSHLELRLWVLLAVSLVLLWLAHRLFIRLQGNFAQEL